MIHLTSPFVHVYTLNHHQCSLPPPKYGHGSFAILSPACPSPGRTHVHTRFQDSELADVSAQVGASAERQAARVQASERTKASGRREGGGLSPPPPWRGEAVSAPGPPHPHRAALIAE